MRHGLHAGWIAALVFALATGAATMAAGPRMLADFGRVGSGVAMWWNVLGFSLPGLLVAGFALALESPMREAGARRGGRIGSTLLMLSGLFFAAQGILIYDANIPDERASQLHVAALSLGLIAFLPAAALIAASLRRVPEWRLLRWLGSVFACILLLGLVLPPEELRRQPDVLQRIMLAAYFAWIALAAISALRARSTQAE